jgi:hypothetical protein
VRVTYNWLYSALNCDPADNSPFVWVIRKIDSTHTAISPKDTYRGMTLYASVRDDWDWYVEVQAAHSADWIRAVGRNETLALESGDMLTVSLRGFNGQYLAVDAAVSTHDKHSGYRLRSTGTGDIKSRTFFLGISRTLQAGLAVTLAHQVTGDDIRRGAVASGLTLAADEIVLIQSHLK